MLDCGPILGAAWAHAAGACGRPRQSGGGVSRSRFSSDAIMNELKDELCQKRWFTSFSELSFQLSGNYSRARNDFEKLVGVHAKRPKLTKTFATRQISACAKHKTMQVHCQRKRTRHCGGACNTRPHPLHTSSARAGTPDLSRGN